MSAGTDASSVARLCERTRQLIASTRTQGAGSGLKRESRLGAQRQRTSTSTRGMTAARTFVTRTHLR